MNKKLMAVMVLGAVFSISAVYAKSKGNGKGHGKPEWEEDVSVAAATSTKPNFPRVDIHKGTFYVPCVEVVNSDKKGFEHESHFWVEVDFEQQGSSNNWKPVDGKHVGTDEDFSDCEEALEFFENQ